MIVSKIVKIIISKRTISKIKELGYDVNIGDIIDLPVSHLGNGSHAIVDVRCDICDCEKKIMYQKYQKNIKNGNFYSCSSKCSQKKVKATSIKKYGKEYYTQTTISKNQFRKSSLERYGETTPLKSDLILRKIRKTNLKKYGVENPFSSKDIVNKIRKTNLKKYGVENPSKSNIIKEDISNKMIDLWKNKSINFYNDMDVVSYEDGIYTINCDQNHQFKITKSLLSNRRFLETKICTICNDSTPKKFSGQEVKLREFVYQNYQKDILLNDRSLIGPYEVDIYLPDIKLAIEFNGLYWHSEMKKGKNYHFNKHKLCKDKGVELFQIYEDDWKYKTDIVKSILKNKINKSSNIVHARKCDVKIVSSSDSFKFLEESHIQGPIRGKINIGLYFNNDLISIMTLGKIRKSLGNNDNVNKYEIFRCCNKLDHSILGGISKMLSFFRKNYQFDEIHTYYDKSFGYENMYEKIGFDFKSETPPNYYYIVDGIKRHRYNYRKDILVKQGYDSSKTEKEIMSDRGIYRIYNSGNYKYVINGSN